MKYGLLTHWDLDGAMSEYLIRKVFDIQISKAQGYAKLPINAEKLYYEGVTDLLITDMSPTPETLQWCLDHFNSVTLYDHHQESDRFTGLDQVNPKYTHHYSGKMCGAAVVYQAHKDEIDLSNREVALLQYTDIYDMWREKRPEEQWLTAHKLNDLFWHYTGLEFWGFLPQLDTIDIANLSEEQEEICDSLVEKRKKEINDGTSVMLDSNSIITLMTGNTGGNYVSWYLDLDQFDNDASGVWYNLHYGDNGNIKGSFRVDSSLPEYNLNTVLRNYTNLDIIASAGGHSHACGVEFATDDIDMACDFIEMFDVELHKEFK